MDFSSKHGHGWIRATDLSRVKRLRHLASGIHSTGRSGWSADCHDENRRERPPRQDGRGRTWLRPLVVLLPHPPTVIATPVTTKTVGRVSLVFLGFDMQRLSPIDPRSRR